MTTPRPVKLHVDRQACMKILTECVRLYEMGIRTFSDRLSIVDCIAVAKVAIDSIDKELARRKEEPE